MNVTLSALLLTSLPSI